MRKEKPTGREISEKAKQLRLRDKDIVEGTKTGKRVKFTPGSLDHLKNLDELEDGQIIGVLENEIEGPETGLPPGKYNAFLTKMDGKWHVFTEAGGEIKAEAAKVEVKFHKVDERKESKGRFYPEGWCIGICLISVFFGLICLVEVQFCF